MGTIIEFKHVYKYYDESDTPAVADTNLTIEDGDFVTILGTSGSGKTTLLKMVNGLIPLSEGAIEFQGKNINDLDITKYRRNIGYVIQHAGLFPHRTTAENIATVPSMLGWDKKKIDERVDELLEMMKMDPGQYRDKYPRMLSGGEQQRVGIARALAADPPLLLMDEPFGAIDAITREHLQNELCRIQSRLKKTILFVTHDIQEAFKMGDKVIVMHDGRVQQYASPYDIVFNPATEYVVTLINTGNFFDELKAISAKTLMKPVEDEGEEFPTVLEGDNASSVLETMLREKANSVYVCDYEGAIVGRIDLDTITSQAAPASTE